MSDFKIVQLLNPIQINVPINPTGVYNPATTYAIGDSVSYGNSSYICILASTGNVPTNTAYWQLLASSATNKLTTTARNNTGSTIPKGSVVYFNGALGNLPTLALSIANTEPTSSKTVGITSVSIANNSNGEILILGLAESLDTSAFTVGLSLWLSPTIAGAMTNTKPSAPNHAVFIGTTTRSHPTDGTIEIKVQNGFELDELHNVSISSVADNQVLKYDAPNLLWKNETLVKGDVGLSNVPNVDATVASNIVEDSTHRFVTDTEKTTWNGKENSITSGTTAQYWRGDKSWQTLNSTAVGLGNVPNVDATNPSNISQTSSYRFVGDTQTSDWDAKLSTNGMAYVTNKDFDWATVRFVSTTNNAFLKFDLTGSTGAYQNVFMFNNTANNSYTYPNATGTVALTSDISTAVSSKVNKSGDTMTGALDFDVALATTTPLVFVRNSSPNGIASLLATNDLSSLLSIGVTGSTITGLPVPNDEAFLYSSNAINAITTLAGGFKWHQDGTQVASIINAVFTASSIDASPINFTGLTQVTPTISDFFPFTNGATNYKASLNEMPVSAPQNLNSIVNAIIFG